MNAGKIYTYSVSRREKGLIEAAIVLDGDHPVYGGHFPGLPLTPGVCQVEMIGDILGRELGRDLLLSSSPAIKFPAMLKPDQSRDLSAEITYSEEEGKLRVRATLGDRERTYLKFRGEFV